MQFVKIWSCKMSCMLKPIHLPAVARYYLWVSLLFLLPRFYEYIESIGLLRKDTGWIPLIESYMSPWQMRASSAVGPLTLCVNSQSYPRYTYFSLILQSYFLSQLCIKINVQPKHIDHWRSIPLAIFSSR